MTAKHKIEILASALMPFAAMYRMNDKGANSEVVCERGTCEDKTMIMQSDFANAMIALKISGVPMTAYVPPLELNKIWKKGKK